MKCRKCGEELPERARFCPECGAPVEEVPAPKKLEEPLEPMGFGAVPLVPVAPPPRATRITPRVPRPYGAARAGRASTRIPLSAYPTFSSEKDDAPVRRLPEDAPSREGGASDEASEPVAPASPGAEGLEAAGAAAGADEGRDRAGEGAPQGASEHEPDERPTDPIEAPEPAAPDATDESDGDGGREPSAERSGAPADRGLPSEGDDPDMTQAIDSDLADLPAPSTRAAEPEPAADSDWPASWQRPEDLPPASPEDGGAPRAGLADRVLSALPRSREQRVLVGVCAVAAALAIAFLVYVSIGWFGPFADRSYVAPDVQPPSDGSIAPLEEEEEEVPAVEGGPEVRDALADYSWTELSQISALIADAESDERAVEIAAYYHLCREDGTIDADNTKTLELTGGTSVPIAVAGFRHDVRSDGSGLAGISFVARGSVGAQPMNALAQMTGGWEGSTLRPWVNEGLLAEMPAELADLLVAVDKTTNPVAGSGATGQTVTADYVWLLSYSEIVGELGEGSWLYGLYQSEGEQYQIFADLGVTWGESYAQLALPSGEYWWERSPSPNNGEWFLCVSPAGETSYGNRPATANAVVIGFCL